MFSRTYMSYFFGPSVPLRLPIFEYLKPSLRFLDASDSTVSFSFSSAENPRKEVYDN